VSDDERIVERRLWSVFMISHTPEVAESVLSGRPVIARNLDAEALRRALRGGSLPDPDVFVVISHEMLDAIAEAGPITPITPRRLRSSGAAIQCSRGVRRARPRPASDASGCATSNRAASRTDSSPSSQATADSANRSTRCSSPRSCPAASTASRLRR
jgi:hypothetical protein